MADKIDRQLVSRGAARSVTGLASMLAHEIKNPLSGIRGAAQLLEQSAGDDDRALTRYRREHVGFVFQFYNLIPSLTARENVALVTDIVDDPYPPEYVLGLVGLGDRLDHFPAQLSGGEQQRVAIARAVAKRPDVLLCDEPTGALDFQTGRRVLETIDQVNRELGTTTAIITHNVPIAKMADRVVTLADGRVIGEERNATRVGVEELQW